jgi:hypothetical protein
VIGALLAGYELWLHHVGQTAPAADSANFPAPIPHEPPDGHPVTASDRASSGPINQARGAAGPLWRAVPAAGVTESSAG